MRQVSRLEAVLGSNERSGSWFDPSAAAYGPVGKDGYPQPLFDKTTGVIDRSVARYWRDHDHDLRDYTEKNWKRIGPQLIGKIKVYVGDMDEFYVNSGVYLFEDFLKHTKAPHYEGSFEYGRPMKGHTWSPMSTAERVRTMAQHIQANAPRKGHAEWN